MRTAPQQLAALIGSWLQEEGILEATPHLRGSGYSVASPFS
jgi:hypothetical protein